MNIHACKYFYGTCLDLSGVLWCPYHCYDDLVFELENGCAFVTSPISPLHLDRKMANRQKNL